MYILAFSSDSRGLNGGEYSVEAVRGTSSSPLPRRDSSISNSTGERNGDLDLDVTGDVAVGSGALVWIISSKPASNPTGESQSENERVCGRRA